MSYSLFRNGQKPSYLCNKENEPLQFQELIDAEIPFLFVPIFTNEDTVLFFANEAIKTAFIERADQLETNSPQYHQLIGEVLGFPPLAAAFFANCMTDKELKQRRAGYSYAGMDFVGDIQDRDTIAAWCWERVPVAPEPLEVDYQGEVSYISPSINSR